MLARFWLTPTASFDDQQVPDPATRGLLLRRRNTEGLVPAVAREQIRLRDATYVGLLLCRMGEARDWPSSESATS